MYITKRSLIQNIAHASELGPSGMNGLLLIHRQHLEKLDELLGPGLMWVRANTPKEPRVNKLSPLPYTKATNYNPKGGGSILFSGPT